MDVCKEGSELFVYADDAKLFSHINSAKDVITLQNDLNVMNNWIKEWSLNLNILANAELYHTVEDLALSSTTTLSEMKL